MPSKKHYILPEPKDKLGYTRAELSHICRDLNIYYKEFWDAFGVNTCAVGKDGTSRFYKCDVENALYRLKKMGGKFYPWD